MSDIEQAREHVAKVFEARAGDDVGFFDEARVRDGYWDSTAIITSVLAAINAERRRCIAIVDNWVCGDEDWVTIDRDIAIIDAMKAPERTPTTPPARVEENRA